MGASAKIAIASVTLAAVAAALCIHRCDRMLDSRLYEDKAPRPGSGRRPGRLVLFTPAIVEIVFALGAGDRVVGRTRFASYPPGALRLPPLGGQEDINYERMTALAPDMVITQNAGEKLSEYAGRRGIALVDLEIENKRDLLRACVEIGRALGIPDAGRALAARIERSLGDVEKAVAGLPRTPVFLSLDRSPGPLKALLSAGRDTLLTELVEIAGGRNLFADASLRYPVVSKETLLVRAPEVVLELRPSPLSPVRQASLISDWDALSSLAAVRNRRVRVIAHEAVLIPGPRIGEVARLIAAALHPGAVSEAGSDGRGDGG